MPPRFIVDSIFCIQFSPVMRTSFFTSGNRPQNVKNTVVCIPIAAPLVARINVGHMRSSSPLHAKITSLSGIASSIASAVVSSVSSVIVLTSSG